LGGLKKGKTKKKKPEVGVRLGGVRRRSEGEKSK